MIVYFADRSMNVLGMASTGLPEGFIITNDNKTEDIDTGVAVFSGELNYRDDEHVKAKSLVRVGNFVLRENHDKFEAYTIIEIEDNTLSQTIYFYAEDAGLDLLNSIADAYEADQAYSAEYYVMKWAGSSGFKMGINEISNLNRKLSWDGESTVTERIRSIATQFDNAEVSYSFDVKDFRITNKYINIYKRHGKDVALELRHGREVGSIIEKSSIAELATALLVTGGTPEATDSVPEPKPITLKGYAYDDGDIYVDANGYLKSRDALSKWGRYLADGQDAQDAHIVRTYSWDTLSQSELAAHAITQLKKSREPEINYEVDLLYLPENLVLGDTVRIVDDNGELYLSARLLKLEESYANDSRIATFGDFLIKSSGISDRLAKLAEDVAKVAAARTLYTWIVYADDQDGTNITTDPEGKAYMGVATNKIASDPDLTDPYIYSWSKIEGAQGEQGPVGPAGEPAEPLTIESAVTEYCINNSGTELDGVVILTEDGQVLLTEDGVALRTEQKAYDWSEDVPEVPQGMWLWTRVTITYSDGSQIAQYSVARQGVDGADGKGVRSVVDYYAASSSNTIAPEEGWVTNPSEVELTETNRYLWNYEVTTYTNDDVEETAKHVIGAHGQTGVGIDSVDEYYALSETTTIPADSEFSTTVKTVTAQNKYLWNYEVINYSNGSTERSEKHIIGVYGDKGDAGDRGATWYAGTAITGTNTTAQIFPGSGISDAKVGDHYLNTSTQNVYICTVGGAASVAKWAYEQNIKGDSAHFHVKYSNDGGTTFTGNDGEDPGSYIGTYSDNSDTDSMTPGDYKWVRIEGVDGRSVESVTNYYLATSASSGVTRDTAGWTTNPTSSEATMTETKQYLWNYEKTLDALGAQISITDPVIIGRYGQNGGTGPAGKGISSITEYYLASNESSGVTRDTSGWTTAVQSTSKEKKYLWNYEVINYTSGNPYQSDPRIIGTYGDSVTVTETKYKEGTSPTTAPTGEWSSTPVTVAEGNYLWTRVTYSDGTQSYSVAKQGATGGKGDKGDKGDSITVTSSSSTYAVGVSGQIFDNLPLETESGVSILAEDGTVLYTEGMISAWSEEVPEVPQGMYLWTKTVTTYSDSSETISYTCAYQAVSPTIVISKEENVTSIEITDQNGTKVARILDGEKGDDGISVVSVETQFYLSSSNTTQTGGSWGANIPSYVDNYYYWRREVTTYSDGTVTYGTPVLDPGVTDSMRQSKNALASANGKNKNFYQTVAPVSGMTIGDLWFDTDNDNKIYRYNGTAWVETLLGDAAFGNIDAGKIVANEITANSAAANVLNVGIIQSADGESYFDLTTGELVAINGIFKGTISGEIDGNDKLEGQVWSDTDPTGGGAYLFSGALGVSYWVPRPEGQEGSVNIAGVEYDSTEASFNIWPALTIAGKNVLCLEYADITIPTVDILTRTSGGAYVSSADVYFPSVYGIDGTLIAVTIGGWTRASGNFTAYIRTSSNQFGFQSDISQSVTGLKLRVLYIPN